MRSPTAERRRMTDLNRRTHLLERKAELEQIGDALRTAAAGSGRIVLIEGAPGIGKSSLLDEAAELTEAARMTVLRARGGVMEREFALGVVIQLLAPSIEPLTERERERVFAGAAGLARPLFEEVPDRAAADDRLFARFLAFSDGVKHWCAPSDGNVHEDHGSTHMAIRHSDPATIIQQPMATSHSPLFQFGAGCSTESITSSSTGPRAGSSFNPSCS